MKSYQSFLEDLGARESGGQYDIENSLGYLGKYQFGKSALTDIGYYGKNDWTGKDGVYNKEIFLNSPKIQEKAIKEFQEKIWSYIKHYNLDKHINREIIGIKITTSGLLAGYHLKGIGASAKSVENDKSNRRKGLRSFLESEGKINGADEYGTKISEYIKKFADYKTPFDKNSTILKAVI